MARNEISVQAPIRQVFGLLSDPRTYGYWVVGTRSILAADRGWPSPGTGFDHQVGLGPFSLSDHTSVVSSRPPEEIVLHARLSPLPPARVKLCLRPEPEGTRITMIEAPANPVLSLLLGPLGHWLLTIRNLESLRRLKLLAEGDELLPTGQLPKRRPGDNG